MAGIFQKLSGIIGSVFQVGGQTGPAIRNNSGTVELKNAANTAFAKLNASQPSTWTNNAVITAAMLEKAFLIADQFDSSVAAPANTTTLRFIICTTAGNGFSVGDIAFDNGLNTGDCVKVPTNDGMLITVPTALTGGTLEFPTTGAYVRLSSTFTLLNSGVAGVNKSIKVPFVFGDFGGTVSSTTKIPADSTILRTRVLVTTLFDDVPTVEVGYALVPGILQATTDNDLTATGVYIVDGTTTNVDWPATDKAVLLTFTGTPTAGAGEVIVEYCTPDT